MVPKARVIHRWLLLGLALALLPVGQGRALAELEPDEAVELGKETLSKGLLNRHPWYDSSTDDVTLIPLKQSTQNTSTRWDWSWDWPDWTWEFSLFGNTFSVNLFTLMLWGVVLVLAFFLVRYLIRLYERRELEDAASDDDDTAHTSDADRVEALPVVVKREISDLRSEARRLADGGRYSEAIVYLYSHLLVQLDRRQVIRLAKGKTNRQYLSEAAAANSSLKPPVERTMTAFEDAYFGRHELTPAEFEACWADVQRLFDAVLQPQEALV
jgi:uncharacterized membrane protein